MAPQNRRVKTLRPGQIFHMLPISLNVPTQFRENHVVWIRNELTKVVEARRMQLNQAFVLVS
jgi:hypothetical protein